MTLASGRSDGPTDTDARFGVSHVAPRCLGSRTARSLEHADGAPDIALRALAEGAAPRTERGADRARTPGSA